MSDTLEFPRSEAATTSGTFIGHVDGIVDGHLTGWMMRVPEEGGYAGDCSIEVSCDDAIIAVIVTDEDRPDVMKALDAGASRVKCGFRLPLPSECQGFHATITVRMADSGQELAGSPIQGVDAAGAAVFDDVVRRTLDVAKSGTPAAVASAFAELEGMLSPKARPRAGQAAGQTVTMASLLADLAAIDGHQASRLRRATDVELLLNCLRNERLPLEAACFEALSERMSVDRRAGDPGMLEDAGCLVSAYRWLEGLDRGDRTRLFDEGYYRGTLYADQECDDVALHYIARGAQRGLSPNPFFDPWTFAREHRPHGQAGSVPFFECLTARDRRPFHPLVDAQAGRDASSGQDIFLGLATLEAMPSELKRARTDFRRWRQLAAQTTIQNSARFLIDENHPFADEIATAFDPRFYHAQLAAMGEPVEFDDLLSHLFREEGKLDPHPLFSTRDYLANNGDVGAKPFSHFIEFGCREGRHTSFWMTSYARVPQPGCPLFHYLRQAPSTRPRLSAIFLADFYQRQMPDIDWTLFDPFLHYLAVGAARRRPPHPAIDPDFVEQHNKGFVEANAFNVLALVEHPQTANARGFAFFDFEAYRALNTDLAYCDEQSALRHFLEYGYREGHRELGVFSRRYVLASQPDFYRVDEAPIIYYLLRRLNRRRRILFIGHEATRTGAPAILLEIVRHFSRYANVECITLLDKGGDLTEDFAEVSHASISGCDRSICYHDPKAFEQWVERFLLRFEDNPPFAVICNTAETREYAQVTKRQAIPTILLMHEYAEMYPRDVLRTLSASVDQLVLPARYVADSLRRRDVAAAEKSIVLPQGLLRDGFAAHRASFDRRSFYRNRGLAISSDHVVVLGCGSITGRKGFDLFIQVAHAVKRRSAGSGDGKIRFMWVGGSRNWRYDEGAKFDALDFWASWDMDRLGVTEMISVLPEVSDTEAFFQASDLFLLTSRVDPFPCVVHEAMAAGLPVLCFAGGSGAPEAFGSSGISVPMFDIEGMASEIVALAGDQARRRQLGLEAETIVRRDFRFADYGERLKALVCSLGDVDPSELGPSTIRKQSRGRVYFANADWGLSGVNTFTEGLVTYLNRQGFEAEILFTNGPHIDYRVADEDGRLTDLLPAASFRMLQPPTKSPADKAATLRKFLKAQAPCILLPGYDYDTSQLAPELPSEIGVIGVAHSDDIEHYEHSYRYGPYWNRTVAVSGRIAGKLDALNPSISSRLSTIRYGIDAPELTIDSAVIRAKIETAAPIEILFAGRFEQFQKRILDYCELVPALARAGVDFRLEMAGTGSMLEAVRRRLSPFVASGQVALPGRVAPATLHASLARAHVLLVLSEFEGLPLSVVEALHHGCVPLCYDIDSGIPEIIGNGDNGFVVPRGDIGAIVSAIAEFARDRAARARMIESALRTPKREHLTLDAMGASYAALIEDILGKDVNGGFNRERIYA